MAVQLCHPEVVRQCFADLGILAEQDPESIKGSDFKAERVSYIRSIGIFPLT